MLLYFLVDHFFPKELEKKSEDIAIYKIEFITDNKENAEIVAEKRGLTILNVQGYNS